MNLAEVMDAVAAQLDTIEGLRAFGWPGAQISPPAAVAMWPTGLDFDQTYRRGADRLTLPVLLLAGPPTERQTRDRLAVYCNGSGDSSVKQVLEAGSYTAFDTVRVTGAEFDVYTISGTGTDVQYMGAMFSLDIIGSGT